MTVAAIDLGTAHTRIAVWQNDTVKVLRNDKGNRTTPSCVAFTTTERLIGDSAKNQMAMNVHNTVYDLKRLMGRKYSDLHVICDMAKWPFKLQESSDLYPNIELDAFQSRRLFKPEAMMAMILESAKETAENFVGKSVTDVVITVPSFFGSVQRQAIRDAAHIAGLNVRRLLNETTAAGLAYGMEYKVKGKQTVLIYHLGAGTFDVAVMQITNGHQFEVLGVEGNSCLGGIDLDDQLVQHFVVEIKRQNNIIISNNPRAMRRLRTACESLKKILSTNLEAVIEVDSLCGDLDFSSSITREKFYSLSKGLFEETFNSVVKLLAKLNLDKTQIDEVFLIGGSTRIPKVTKWHEEYFGTAKMNYTMNAEEIVVTGAAVQAGALDSRKMIVKEVSSIPLYVREFVPFKDPQKLFDRLDAKVAYQCVTKGDNTTEARITICEMMDGSHFCESYQVINIPEAPAGAIKLNFNFHLDANGIFTFPSATIVSKSCAHKLVVYKHPARLNVEAIDRAKAEAQMFRMIDRDIRQRKAGRVQFENEILSIELELAKSGFSSTVKRIILNSCCDELGWLAQNPLESVSTFDNRIQALKALVGQVRAREEFTEYLSSVELEFQSLNHSQAKTVTKHITKHREWLEQNQESSQELFESRLKRLKLWATDLERNVRKTEIANYKSYLTSLKKQFVQFTNDYGPNAVAELEVMYAIEMSWLAEKAGLERIDAIKKRSEMFATAKDGILVKHQKAIVLELEKICITWLEQTSANPFSSGLSDKKAKQFKSYFEDELNWLHVNEKSATYAEVKQKIESLDTHVKRVIRKKSSMLEQLKLWYTATFTWK